MSRISRAVKQQQEENKLSLDQTVKNFMGGDSYVLDPLDTLKMLAASSIFGEPQYYRTNGLDDGKYEVNDLITDQLFKDQDCKTTTEIFTAAIDAALDYDFHKTLQLAVTLRHTYHMRLNPQIIMVRAAIHPKRKQFTKKHPGLFLKIEMDVMLRADEPAIQAAYYLYLNHGKKNQMPSILKRAIAHRLSNASPYEINKYKNAEIGMINTVRLVHANSHALDELMKTRKVFIRKHEKTWEQLRSEGKSWNEIISSLDIAHMARLRNLRNVFEEISNAYTCVRYLDKLEEGVCCGEQFPFRYESAYRAIKESNVHHKMRILDSLERCIDKSLDNLPRLKGRTMCLSDNSGSAWGSFNSEYGTQTIANIDNLSSVIAAAVSDEGYVGKFGDELRIFEISKRQGILQQANEIDKDVGRDVGTATEGGIWIFFMNAIRDKEWYDNIFIFSDQQAGTGGLYGNMMHQWDYINNGYGLSDGYINIYQLILDYRKKVNPKVNVFSVQTAGYDNILIPKMSYRCAMLTGWTGKEVLFASEYIKQWDLIEHKNR